MNFKSEMKQGHEKNVSYLLCFNSTTFRDQSAGFSNAQSVLTLHSYSKWNNTINFNCRSTMCAKKF